jgi:hypothetical protein
VEAGKRATFRIASNTRESRAGWRGNVRNRNIMSDVFAASEIVWLVDSQRLRERTCQLMEK